MSTLRRPFRVPTPEGQQPEAYPYEGLYQAVYGSEYPTKKEIVTDNDDTVLLEVERILTAIDAEQGAPSQHNQELAQHTIGRTLGASTLELVEMAWELYPHPDTKRLAKEFMTAYPVPEIGRTHKDAFDAAQIEGISFGKALDKTIARRKKPKAT